MKVLALIPMIMYFKAARKNGEEEQHERHPGDHSLGFDRWLRKYLAGSKAGQWPIPSGLKENHTWENQSMFTLQWHFWYRTFRSSNVKVSTLTLFANIMIGAVDAVRLFLFGRCVDAIVEAFHRHNEKPDDEAMHNLVFVICMLLVTYLIRLFLFVNSSKINTYQTCTVNIRMALSGIFLQQRPHAQPGHVSHIICAAAEEVATHLWVAGFEFVSRPLLHIVFLRCVVTRAALSNRFDSLVCIFVHDSGRRKF